MDAFRLLFHSDLMLLTGFREVLVGLFAPQASSIKLSEKRPDGGLDAASKQVRLPLRPSEARGECSSDDSSDVKNLALCCGSCTSMDVEG